MEICKHNQECGGCIYQGIEYEKQREMKGKEVLRLLEKKGIQPEEFGGIQVAYRLPLPKMLAPAAGKKEVAANL